MTTMGYEPDLPFPIRPMGEWRERALCAEKIRNGEAEQRWWFPERGDPGIWCQQAKAICWECPVRKDCLDWAVENRERGGIWGGVNDKNRGHMRATAGKVYCQTCGVEVDGDIRVIYCGPCRHAAAKETQRLSRAQWRAKKKQQVA